MKDEDVKYEDHVEDDGDFIGKDQKDDIKYQAR